MQGRRQSPDGSETPPLPALESTPIKISSESPQSTPKTDETAKEIKIPLSPQPGPMQLSPNVTSESIEILRHADGCTAAPPNTFVPSSSYLSVPNGLHKHNEENNTAKASDAKHHPRSYTDFEQQIINRLENVFIHQSDSFSEKGSDVSAPSSQNLDGDGSLVNGHVESPVDPQTALTQSGEVL